ncbi:hypothetical protein ACQP3L_34690, partial [Escherichia coli]
APSMNAYGLSVHWRMFYLLGVFVTFGCLSLLSFSMFYLSFQGGKSNPINVMQYHQEVYLL